MVASGLGEDHPGSCLAADLSEKISASSLKENGELFGLKNFPLRLHWLPTPNLGFPSQERMPALRLGSLRSGDTCPVVIPRKCKVWGWSCPQGASRLTRQQGALWTQAHAAVREATKLTEASLASCCTPNPSQAYLPYTQLGLHLFTTSLPNPLLWMRKEEKESCPFCR